MSEQKFEPFQRVLMRYCKGDPWFLQLYGYKTDRGYCGLGSSRFEDCIPYEGNEHLLGTTNDPAPKWEPKRGDLVLVREADGSPWMIKFFVIKAQGKYWASPYENITDALPWSQCKPYKPNSEDDQCTK